MVTKKRLRCPRCGMAIGLQELACPACGGDVGLWIRRGEQLYGPFTLAQVIDGVRQGRIVETDEISVGTGQWMRVGEADLRPPTPAVRRPQAVSSARTLRIAGLVFLTGVVVAGALAGYGGYAHRQSALRTKCAQNLRCIYLAWRAYRLAHGEPPRPGPDWPSVLAEFIPPTAEWWTCPRTGRPYVVVGQVGVEGGQTTGGGRAGVLVGEDPRARGFHGRWLYVDASGRVAETSKPSWQGTPVTGYRAGEARGGKAHDDANE